jgi:hypothetical protein
MKNPLLISALSLVLLSSCNDAEFDRYPGTKVDIIPKEFRGVFKDPDSKSKNTIIVDSTYWMESSKREKNYLGDSNVLSAYNGAYYLSHLEASRNRWQVMHVTTSGKDIVLYALTYDTKKKPEENKITKYFQPQLDKDSNTYFVMNEEMLWQYSHKELLREEAMRLKRVKQKK